MPAAATRRTTSPGIGDGSGRSTGSSCRGPVRRTARTVSEGRARVWARTWSGDGTIAAMTEATAGFFGPGSVSWRVHGETTVLFGGARAPLMQAAHPLVIAGARETGFYERNPWARLERTLRLTYSITFGTKDDARAAATRIHEGHRAVH